MADQIHTLDREKYIAGGPVLGEGPLDASILLVGEAPGKDEVLLGRPFIGKAGKELDARLELTGLRRGDLRMENAFQYHPVGNKIEHFLDPGTATKKPKWTDLAVEELARLKAVVEASPCNVIGAVGNVPLFMLTGEKGITKWNRSTLPCTLVPGKKVVPIIHPAATLREYLFGRQMVQALKVLKEQSEFPEIKLPNPTLQIVKNFDNAMHYLDSCLRAKRVACDIETTQKQDIHCIGFAFEHGHAFSIPLLWSWERVWSAEREANIWFKISQLLADERVEKVWQNGIFDRTFLFEKFGMVSNNNADTMVAQAIVMPDYSKGLDFITANWTQHNYYKDDGKLWKSKKRPTEEEEVKFHCYNAMDCLICFEAIDLLHAELKRQGNWEVYQRHMNMHEPMMYVTVHGCAVDHRKAKIKVVELEQEKVELQAKLDQLAQANGVQSLNTASPKQLKNYFYVVLNHTPYTKKGGAISTDEDALKRLARKGVEEANIIITLRGIDKKLQSFAVKYRKDRRFRGSIAVVGTQNGRPSSSKLVDGTGNNMFNRPPCYKDCLVPDPDYAMYVMDLGQAENRIVANVADERAMIGAFENGVDVHALTGSFIASAVTGRRWSWEEVKEADKLFEKTSDRKYCASLGGGNKTWRFWGKSSNHALNYDMSYKLFALNNEIPEKDAREIVEHGYHRAYPAVRGTFHAHVQEKLRHNRTLENLLGRKRLFLNRWGKDLFKEAYAFIPQSTVADLTNTELKALYDDPECEDVELLNTVYDSLIFQLPLALGWKFHARVLRKIAERWSKPLTWKGRTFRIPVDTKICVSMGEGLGVALEEEALEEAWSRLTHG